jgi:hypothetical protein
MPIILFFVGASDRKLGHRVPFLSTTKRQRARGQRLAAAAAGDDAADLVPTGRYTRERVDIQLWGWSETAESPSMLRCGNEAISKFRENAQVNAVSAFSNVNRERLAPFGLGTSVC